MENYDLPGDLNVFGFRVKNFPDGIGEAFDKLVAMLPGGFNRSFYGISQMNNDGSMGYFAAAEEKEKGEPEKYNCERRVIAKGKFLTVTIKDWRDKTGSINQMFHKILQDQRADKTKPAVEWYKNDDEMVCMVYCI